VWVRRNKLLRAAGVPQGLTLGELTKPDLRVVRRNLSALINFHKFRDERLAAYQAHSEAHKRLEAELAAAERAGEELERRLGELRGRRAAARPEEERVGHECVALTAEIEALNTSQAQLRAQTEDRRMWGRQGVSMKRL
jgi:chromosome segregation ATPase